MKPAPLSREDEQENKKKCI